MDYESVVDELYGLPPSEFTQARDARVAAARQEGDAKAAAALKKLRRPTLGAWLANQMVRQRRDDVDRILALGEQLREAQARLDGEGMRRLSGEGRAAVVALVGQASDVARNLGVDLSQSAIEDLEASLDAALTDGASAAALRKGRLTSALHYSGLGLVDAMDAEAVGSADRGHRRAPPASNRELARAQKDLERMRSQLQDAETAVAAAKATLAERKEVVRNAARRVQVAEKAVRNAEKGAKPRGGTRR